jgi:hypothetical protein
MKSDPHLAYSAKNKRWYTEDEAVAWIVTGSHEAVRQAGIDAQGLRPSGRPQTPQLILAVREAEKRLWTEPKNRKLFGAGKVIEARRALRKCIKRGLIQTSPTRDTIRVEDVKRIWPAASGRGKGQPLNISLDPQHVQTLRAYFLSHPRDKTDHELNEWCAVEFGCADPEDGRLQQLSNNRFRKLKRISLISAIRSTFKDYTVGLIDVAVLRVRLVNLATWCKKGRPRKDR